jgi:hypothetical protein
MIRTFNFVQKPFQQYMKCNNNTLFLYNNSTTLAIVTILQCHLNLPILHLEQE